MRVLELRGAGVRFADKRILGDLSLALTDGVVTCVLGPSGCGKTTLLRAMAGLLPLDSGTLSGLEGRRASFVFQEDRLLPWFDALDNLLAVGATPDAAQAALDSVLLGGEAHTLPPAMSGGMQRRLAIARALAFGGDLFFLDEPMRGLDVATAQPVLAAMRAALAGRTALLITHSPEEALALGDRLLRVSGPPIVVTGWAGREEFADKEVLTAWLQGSL